MSKRHYSAAFGLLFTLFSTFIFAQQSGNPFPKVSNPNEQTYKIKTASSTIEGVLRVPKTSISAGTAQNTLVFIVPDASGTDRDGNMGDGIKAAPYRHLSENLAANGIATFRYDKRGVGNSTFEGENKPIVFEDFIGDAQKCLDSLRASGKFSKIIVAGHGEGALVGMILAQRTPFDGFVSLAASAKRIDSFMVDQVRRGSPELAYALRVVYDKWEKNEPVDSFPKAIKDYIHPALKPFVIDMMRFMPTVEIAKVRVPTLIIHGKTDVSVPFASGVRLSKAKPDAQFYLHESMNHVLKDGDLNLLDTKKVNENPNLPLSTGLVSTIVNFIIKVEAGSK